MLYVYAKIVQIFQNYLKGKQILQIIKKKKNIQNFEN